MMGLAARLQGVPRILLYAAAAALLCIYFGQYVLTPPNASEGAVMMDYVQRVASGQRLYFDFFDYYGPVTWLPYGIAYVLGGQTVVSVRLLLVLLKILSVLLAYRLILRVGGPFYALLGALVTAVLLGQPWPFFQIPYAPHIAFPLELGLWLSVLPYGLERSGRRIGVAALLTALLLWTKVNTGAFALLGVAFYLFYWVPSARAGHAPELRLPVARPLRVLQVAGLALIGSALLGFMARHLISLYFVYLALPLLLLLGWTFRHVRGEWRIGGAAPARLRAALSYVGATLALWLLVLFAYFGFRGSAGYLAEQWAVLSRLHVESPLLAPGAKGQYHAFNVYCWPQLPWLLMGMVVDWLFTVRSARAEDRASLGVVNARVAGLFGVSTFHGFVMYARGDESHLIQIVLPAAVVLFAMLGAAESVELRAPATRRKMRLATAVITVLAAGTLFSPPVRADFAWRRGDWKSQHLAHLRQHTGRDMRAAELPVSWSYREWDEFIDRIAQKLDDLTAPGEEVLVLGGTQLLNYASGTAPAGGKYSHLFYLLRCGLLNRQTFLELMPEAVLDRLLRDPPRIVVTEDGDDAVLDALPELMTGFHRARYEFISNAGPFAIYSRIPPERLKAAEAAARAQ